MINKTRFSALIILISLCFAPSADGAEFRIQPSLAVSEEYNDNILLSHDNRINDYITGVIPSLYSIYKTALWDWDATLSYNYYYYLLNKDISDSYASWPAFNLTNRTRIIKEFLFLDVKDTFTRTSRSVVQDYTTQSLFVNQTNVNTLIVNPYFVVRPSSQMTVTTGYQYRNLWYEDPTSIDKIEHSGYSEAKQDLSPKTTGTMGLKFIRTEPEFPNVESHALDYDRTDLYAGPRYEYAEGSSLWLTIGNSWFNFKVGEGTSQVFWDTGIIHKFRTFTLSFNSGLSYIDDPSRALVRRQDSYSATISKQTERTALSLTAALREYRNAVSKHLQERSYESLGTMSHAFTPHLKLILRLSIQRIEDYQVFDKPYHLTDVYLSGVRVEKILLENLTGSLDFRYTNNYAPDDYTSNYYNNRIMVEVSQKF